MSCKLISTQLNNTIVTEDNSKLFQFENSNCTTNISCNLLTTESNINILTEINIPIELEFSNCLVEINKIKLFNEDKNLYWLFTKQHGLNFKGEIN